MRSVLATPFLLTAFALFLSAQQAPKSLTTDWDMAVILREISAHSNRLLPVIDEIDPSSWILKGAPDAYVAQWKSAKAQAKALADAALTLSKTPDRLSADLEAYFRLQGLEYSLESLGAGIRKYQSPSLADKLATLVAENGANKGRFQTYIVELAGVREQEFQVMDREAQRCRDQLVRQPAPTSKTGRK